MRSSRSNLKVLMEFRSPKTFKSHTTTTMTTEQDCSAATGHVPFDTDSAQLSCKSIPLSGTDDCTEPVSGGQQHEESHEDSIYHGDAFECRISIRCSGFHWNQNRTSAGASGGSRDADAAGVRFHLGCGLLVSRRKPLQMARRLLDPSTVR